MGKGRTKGSRSHWTEGDARRILAALEESGLPLPEFAREAGVEARRLVRWKRRLEGQALVGFHPVRVVAERDRIERDGEGTVEVVLRNGIVVRVSDGTSMETLVRTLVVTSGLPAC